MCGCTTVLGNPIPLNPSLPPCFRLGCVAVLLGNRLTPHPRPLNPSLLPPRFRRGCVAVLLGNPIPLNPSLLPPCFRRGCVAVLLGNGLPPHPLLQNHHHGAHQLCRGQRCPVSQQSHGHVFGRDNNSGRHADSKWENGQRQACFSKCCIHSSTR